MKWFRLIVIRPPRREVLDCASPLALSSGPGDPKAPEDWRSPRRCRVPLAGDSKGALRETWYRALLSLLLGAAALIPNLTWSAVVVAPVQWPGFTNLNSSQVDPHGAAGPQGILSVANAGIAYHSKSGAQLWTTNEQGFFLPTVCCDAKALYDPLSQRFFVIAQEGVESFHVAVSRNSHPLSAGTNDWRLYEFSIGTNQIDYPGIGIDAQALYAGYGSGFRSWLVLRKSDLIAGISNATTLGIVKTPGVSTYSQGMQPATVLGAQSPGDVAYCVTFSNRTTIQLNAITNVLGTRTLFTTNLTVTDFGDPFSDLSWAPQTNTTQRLICGLSSPAMGNAFWHSGSLWFCGPAVSQTQTLRTLVRWYRINTGGFPNGQASLAEWGELDGGPNTWRQQPSISGNANGDVCIVFTQTSSNSVPAIYASLRKANETSFQTILVKTSAAPWTVSASWADYSAVTPDPVDQTFWVTHLTINTTNILSTWWANVHDRAFYVDRNAVGAEIGTEEFPFHTVRAAHTAATPPKTLLIKPANYPEPPLPLRLDKNVRLENPYPSGTVHIGP